MTGCCIICIKESTKGRVLSVVIPAQAGIQDSDQSLGEVIFDHGSIETEQTKINEGRPVRDERWLHFYRQMLKIRLFEEEVNQLYLGAKMPGLAHLYIGEEAVAVGVCEALRQDDYITSTHRGHGHCIAKGASLDRMFAELLGKEAG